MTAKQIENNIKGMIRIIKNSLIDIIEEMAKYVDQYEYLDYNKEKHLALSKTFRCLCHLLSNIDYSKEDEQEPSSEIKDIFEMALKTFVNVLRYVK